MYENTNNAIFTLILVRQSHTLSSGVTDGGQGYVAPPPAG